MASKSKLNISIFYRLVSYMKPYRRFFLISIFCTVLLSILGPLRPALIGNMVDTYIIKSQNKEALVNWILLILGLSSTNSNDEIQYVERVFGAVSIQLKPLVLLGFFGMFITTAESLLNWGASFLTMDAYQQYLNPNATKKRIQIISFGSMTFLSFLAMFFALQIDSLQSLVKITFSIAAGVAPVYILRWIWFRINAWSQLSAMLSSAVFTLLYPLFHTFSPLKQFQMEESRVLTVTILTTIVWLAVTYITPNNSVEVRIKMMPILESRKQFVTRFVIALLLGILFLFLTTICWKIFLS